jgi:hypothetical protein
VREGKAGFRRHVGESCLRRTEIEDFFLLNAEPTTVRRPADAPAIPADDAAATLVELLRSFGRDAMQQAYAHRVAEMEAELGAIRRRLAVLEASPRRAAPAVRRVLLDDDAWRAVRGAIQTASRALKWTCAWQYVPGESRVQATVPSAEVDMVAESTFDFYRALAQALGPSVLAQVNFEFQVEEGAEAGDAL